MEALEKFFDLPAGILKRTFTKTYHYFTETKLPEAKWKKLKQED